MRGTARFIVPLFSSTTGEMVALIEADALGQIRTGAASGVATKYLANTDARIAGIIGTGYQARTQLEAVAAVRRLERVRAFGRDRAPRAICREMSAKIGVPVEPANSNWRRSRARCGHRDPQQLRRQKSRSKAPGSTPGMHINAMGANWPQKRELDAAAVSRSEVIAVDSIEQAKMEAGDLIQAFGEATHLDGIPVPELSAIVNAGKIWGRNNASQITLFKSIGIATWDLAAAVRVF